MIEKHFSGSPMVLCSSDGGLESRDPTRGTPLECHGPSRVTQTLASAASRLVSTLGPCGKVQASARATTLN